MRSHTKNPRVFLLFDDVVNFQDYVVLAIDERRSMEHRWNKVAGEDRSTRRKTCRRASLSTARVTGTGLECTPGLCGCWMAANRISQGKINSEFYFNSCLSK